MSAAALLAAPLLGCKADRLDNEPMGKADAAVTEAPEPPTLQSYPETTPEATVPIQGTTDAERVVVQGSPTGTLIAPILPGGNFCRDVELAPEGETKLNVYAAANGLLSDPVEVVVVRDPGAPQPAMPDCDGINDVPCEAIETCGNEADDDCNGYTDECDLACSGCQDDAFEPNNEAVNVPRIGPGSYDLQICPCRDDWFAFDESDGTGRIVVTALFSHAEVDLDMRLFRAVPGGGTGDQVASSASSDDNESIDFTVDMAGIYYLRVYAFSAGKPQGSYTLEVQ